MNMNELLTLEQGGTPLILMHSDQFEQWLNQQDTFVTSWIQSTGFKGKGLSIIPSQNGTIEVAIFCVKDFSDTFFAGDLANQLPPGQYYFQYDSSLCEDHSQETLEFNLALGWCLGAYEFDKYTNDSATDKSEPEKAAILQLSNASTLDQVQHISSSINLVRDLVNTPANEMMPENLAVTALSLSKEFSGQVTQIIGHDLLEEGFPCIHAVGRASVHAPRLIELTWGDESHPKLTLVGKGVCFDSGGLDLKPTTAMRLMKKDMGGAAHALGLARLIMSRQLPVRLKVLIPAVENAVSSNSFRPGDVVSTRKGTKVEIDNTDAEGRLVLCDALTLAYEEDPDLVIDFATLTGAARVALGTEVGVFFTQNKALSTALVEEGENLTDPLWPLPLHQPYKRLLESKFADLLNCDPGGLGGAITAALYLEHFVNEGSDWIHFDIMAWNVRKQAGRPIGGEAFGVRALMKILEQRYRSSDA